MEYSLQLQNKNFSELTLEEKVDNLKYRIAKMKAGIGVEKPKAQPVVKPESVVKPEPVRSEADDLKAKLLGLKK